MNKRLSGLKKVVGKQQHNNVFESELDGQKVIVKFYESHHDMTFERELKGLRELPILGLRVPKIIDYNTAQRFIVMEYLPYVAGDQYFFQSTTEATRKMAIFLRTLHNNTAGNKIYMGNHSIEEFVDESTEHLEQNYLIKIQDCYPIATFQNAKNQYKEILQPQDFSQVTLDAKLRHFMFGAQETAFIDLEFYDSFEKMADIGVLFHDIYKLGPNQAKKAFEEFLEIYGPTAREKAVIPYYMARSAIIHAVAYHMRFGEFKSAKDELRMAEGYLKRL